MLHNILMKIKGGFPPLKISITDYLNELLRYIKYPTKEIHKNFIINKSFYSNFELRNGESSVCCSFPSEWILSRSDYTCKASLRCGSLHDRWSSMSCWTSCCSCRAFKWSISRFARSSYYVGTKFQNCNPSLEQCWLSLRCSIQEDWRSILSQNYLRFLRMLLCWFSR